MEFSRPRVLCLVLLCTVCCLYFFFKLGVYTYNISNHGIVQDSKVQGRSSGAKTASDWTPKKIASELSFIPYTPGYYCENIFPANTTVPNKTLSELEKLQAKLMVVSPGGVKEGYITTMRVKTLTTIRLVQLPFVKTICETGFNAGHSSLVYLLVKPDVKLYSFDLGIHNYSKPMSEYIASLFPGRFHITFGDSTITIPKFRKAHPNVVCDLISIDGGHSEVVATADFNNFKPMASCANIITFDDYPCPHFYWVHLPLLNTWQVVIRNMDVVEMVKCETYGSFGFTIGRYFLNRCPADEEVPVGAI